MKKSAPSKTKAPAKKEGKGYLEIRFPRLTFRDTPLNVYLVFALVIFAFLLGMLTNKTLYLEKTAKLAATAPTEQAAALPTQPEPPAIVKVENGKLPALGNKDAKVTVVVFSDLQCPFCKRYFDETHGQLIKDYVNAGKAKIYFRHFPLYSIHPNAEKGAEATECANEQGKFWEYHDLLFANQDTWSPQEKAVATNSFVGYASELGLNADQFRSCLDTDKYKKNVSDDAAAGEKVQVDGTPTVFINGHRVVGAQPFEEFKTLIDAELKK